MMSRRHLLAASIAVLATSALVVRAQSTSGGVINACVSPTGALRIVSGPSSCRPPEQPLSWGGNSGLSGYEIVTDDYIFTPGVTEFGSRSVQCPAGKKVLGGGAAALSEDSGGGYVVAHTTALTFEAGSHPLSEDTWTVAYNLSAANIVEGLRIFATCAY